MRFATYKTQNDPTERVGITYPGDNRIYDISLYGLQFRDMNDLIKSISAEQLATLKKLPAPDKGYTEREDYIMLAPIPFPLQDVICLGFNYMDHASELSHLQKNDYTAKNPKAIYFSKRVNEAVGDNGTIPLHEQIEPFLDYEVELAVIIGKTAKNVPPENVYDHIFGYTALNDVSARTIQNSHSQWYFGKSLDGATPMGPYIVTADEIPYPPSLEIKSYVNGNLRQHNNTENLIFGISHVVSELSHGMTLLPGTVISTGTPSGVGFALNPPQNLKRGDVVVCEIEKIGRLTNVVY